MNTMIKKDDQAHMDFLIFLSAFIVPLSVFYIFYTMSVYFMAAHIRKTRWTLPGALLATAGGIAASIILAEMMVK